MTGLFEDVMIHDLEQNISVQMDEDLVSNMHFKQFHPLQMTFCVPWKCCYITFPHMGPKTINIKLGIYAQLYLLANPQVYHTANNVTLSF